MVGRVEQLATQHRLLFGNYIELFYTIPPHPIVTQLAWVTAFLENCNQIILFSKISSFFLFTNFWKHYVLSLWHSWPQTLIQILFWFHGDDDDDDEVGIWYATPKAGSWKEVRMEEVHDTKSFPASELQIWWQKLGWRWWWWVNWILKSELQIWRW